MTGNRNTRLRQIFECHRRVAANNERTTTKPQRRATTENCIAIDTAR